jgi:hypothetical protein
VSKAFGITFAVAVAVIGGLIWFGFVNTKGNHLAPTGSIGKVRTAKAADEVTFMVIDFKVKNDSDRDMIVRNIETSVDSSDGSSIMGGGVAAADIKRAFAAYPALGEQYNPILKERDSVPAHQQIDRMVGVRFDVPAEKIDARKRVVVRLEDITGATVELAK